MAHEKLQCPQCNLPLTAPPIALEVLCPRCNNWLKLDSSCTGACISCHKTQTRENQPSCSEVILEIPKAPKSLLETTASGSESLWRSVFRRVFHVR